MRNSSIENLMNYIKVKCSSRKMVFKSPEMDEVDGDVSDEVVTVAVDE